MRKVKISADAIGALREHCETIMANDPEVEKEWLRYVCEPEQEFLLQTDHDWPLRFVVWYDARKQEAMEKAHTESQARKG